MRRFIPYFAAGVCLCLWSGGGAEGRGFGGFSGGGFRVGGSFAGERSFSGYSGFRSAGAMGSYDRTWTGARGGSVNVEGARGAAVGPWGGGVAGGRRDVTATGPEGRTYSSERQGGVAVGPYGRAVGGASGAAVAAGPRGEAAGGWQTAFAGTRFPTDLGLAHYSAVGAAGVARPTAYWSRAYVTTRGDYVRAGFGYYHCFRPAWYAAHPGCWVAAGWAVGAAWAAPAWAAVNDYCGFGAEPYDYDYGNDIVYQGDTVYVGGKEAGTAEQYAQQATALADKGLQASAPPDRDWKPLGVYALAQGEEQTSNNVFQLAINKDGIIRGNFYDGLTDTTTEVYGSVDRKTQRAAWTIGKKKDRVFEAGMYNLTQAQAPVLVHLGTGRVQQMLLVRMEQPKDAK
jgi:hypothetical protein